MSDLELTVEIEGADGSRRRWGPESPVHERPAGISFSTGLMEGFKTAGLTLRRRTDVDWQDIRLFDKLRIFAAGGMVYEGRVTSLPATGLSEVAVSATGLVAELRDHRVTPLYVDRDLAQWQDTTLARKVASATEDHTKITGSADASGIRFEYGDSPLTTSHVAELYYRAPDGEAVSMVIYKATNTIGAQTILPPVLLTDDNDAFSSATSVLVPIVDGVYHWSSTFATPEQYLLLRTRPSSSLTPTTGTYAAFPELWRVGNRGLTLIATGETAGVTASDVVRDMLREAPSLTAGTIESASYPISQLAFFDPTAPYDIVLAVNAYHLWNFSVWENGRVDFGPIDISDYVWQIRQTADYGVQVELHGDEADEVYSGVEVSFTDAATGQPKRLTPRDTTDLADSSPSNPAVAHGLDKWLELAITPTVVETDAIQIGRMALAEANAPKAPGTITVQGHIRDRQGNWRPAHGVRAGETVAITDHPNSRPRLITETNWDNDQKTMTLTLETAPRGVDGFLDRLSHDIGNVS